MKVIDVIKDLADGKEIKPFKIDNLEFKVINKALYQKELDGGYEDVDWYIYKDWLNEEIEPIEDEFIDIKELYDNSTECNFSDRQTGMTKEDRRLLDSNFKELGNKINEIIKNQKKIIERLRDGE